MKLSPKRVAWPTLGGLKLVHQGKVRDTYDIGKGLLLVVATDAASIFDFVLNTLIPAKGYVLNAMSHFWFLYLESKGIPTHLIAAGAAINEYLPPHLHDDHDLQRRAMVVRKLQMTEWEPGIGVEFIARNALTGSVLSTYRRKGVVGGILLPEGLQDGDALPRAIFTPTTKAEDGHDKPLPPEEVANRFPAEHALYMRAHGEIGRLCRTRGIFRADGKGEIGRDFAGRARIGDEIGTPDCCRFWNLKEWDASRKQADRKAPAPFDKQFLRAFGIELGINKLDPEKPDHVARVHALTVPDEIVGETTDIYVEIFHRITGKTLESYCRDELGVPMG